MPMIGVGNFAPGKLDEINKAIAGLKQSTIGSDPKGDHASGFIAENLQQQVLQIASEVDRIEAFLLDKLGYTANRK